MPSSTFLSVGGVGLGGGEGVGGGVEQGSHRHAYRTQK